MNYSNYELNVLLLMCYFGNINMKFLIENDLHFLPPTQKTSVSTTKTHIYTHLYAMRLSLLRPYYEKILSKNQQVLMGWHPSRPLHYISDHKISCS